MIKFELQPPAPVVNALGYLSVFALGDNQHLYARSSMISMISPGSPPTWADHGTFLPVYTSPLYNDPQTVVTPSSYVSVFLTGRDGQLYERYSTSQGSPPSIQQWGWTGHGTPKGQKLAPVAPSSPAAVSGAISVFAIGDNGYLYELSSNDLVNWDWTDHGHPQSGSIPRGTLPSAVVGSRSIAIFCLGSDNHLYERSRVEVGRPPWAWNWTDHGTLPGGNKILSAPEAVTIPSEFASGDFSVFVIGSDRHLYECSSTLQGSSPWHWTDHGTPLNMAADGWLTAPSPVVNSSGHLEVFVIGSDGHLYERSLTSQGNLPWIWTDHGSPS